MRHSTRARGRGRQRQDGAGLGAIPFPRGSGDNLWTFESILPDEAVIERAAPGASPQQRRSRHGRDHLHVLRGELKCGRTDRASGPEDEEGASALDSERIEQRLVGDAGWRRQASCRHGVETVRTTRDDVGGNDDLDRQRPTVHRLRTAEDQTSQPE